MSRYTILKYSKKYWMSMQDVFNINKHIEKWDDYENLYKLIGYGNLTNEAIEWYKFRAAMAISWR